jgi:hypothetical protein
MYSIKYRHPTVAHGGIPALDDLIVVDRSMPPHKRCYIIPLEIYVPTVVESREKVKRFKKMSHSDYLKLFGDKRPYTWAKKRVNGTKPGTISVAQAAATSPAKRGRPRKIDTITKARTAVAPNAFPITTVIANALTKVARYIKSF